MLDIKISLTCDDESKLIMRNGFLKHLVNLTIHKKDETHPIVIDVTREDLEVALRKLGA